MQGSHPVAWGLAGNFPLVADAASQEGTPRVPAHRVLIVIGDFFPSGASLRWPRVTALRVPRSLMKRNGAWWRVRFAGRAVSVGVRFGSAPTVTTMARVEQVLAGVERAKS
jgi:hypothetical protein